MRYLLASLAAVCVLAATTPNAHAQREKYREGRQHWLETLYSQAFPPLSEWRRAPYGRTPEIDYMLGTSACRISGQRDRGARMLNLILYNYALSSENKLRVTSERDRCRTAGQLAAVSPQDRTALQRLVPAGASARGKMYSTSDAVASYPARQLRAIDPAELERRLVPLSEAARVPAALRDIAPAGARIKVIGRYAFVTTAGQTDAQLGTIATILDNYVGFLRSEYGIEPPDHHLTLYLMPDIDGVRHAARDIHGLDVNSVTLGYAFQEDLSTVAMIRGTQAGTLLHELFHLLVRASFGDIPQWLDEGIASLYEVSTFRDGRQVGLPNWRGRVLDIAWEMRPPLESVITSPWFAFDMTGSSSTGFMGPTERVATHLATARYFALFLQEKGALKRVYTAFRERDPFEIDDPARNALALVTQMTEPPDALQRSYDAWLRQAARRDESNAPNTVGKTLPTQ